MWVNEQKVENGRTYDCRLGGDGGIMIGKKRENGGLGYE